MFVTGGTHTLVATLFLFLLFENVNSKAPNTEPKVGMAPDLEFHPKIIKPKIAQFKPETLEYGGGERDTDTGDLVGLSKLEEFSKREIDEELIRIARDTQRYHMRKRYPDAEEGENEIRHYQRDALDTCTSEFSGIAGHTMCMTDRKDITDSGLKEGDIEIIVDEHNRYRGTVVPPATDLQRLEWNDRLAAVAQKWANQCVLAHDKVRNLPEFPNFVGQNVAVGYENWEKSMKAWYNEIELWHYGVDPESYLQEGDMVGHFTQMVTNTTTLVGCGYAVCTNTEYKRYYVCNYMIGQSTRAYPYTKGDRCAACPGSCTEGLCDCKGKTCNDRGRLILDGCKCECNFPFLGEDCSGVMCPPEDNSRCGTQFTVKDCNIYNNMAVICPYMCGYCTDKDKAIFDNVPPGTGIKVGSFDFFRSEHGCSFFGGRPSVDECQALPSKGVDKSYACATGTGKFGCAECIKYRNVGPEYCPVMCGLCDG